MTKTVDQRHSRLLGHGFFAPELPGCFTSESLSLNRASLSLVFGAIPQIRGRPAYQRFISDKATFYYPRFRNTDRVHSVINPISFFFLSKAISERYADLQKLERKSKYSISRSFFDWMGNRAIRRPPFDSRDEFISRVSTRFEYTVTADIRSFYHAIYTHSIPWAIHGKAFAKKDRDLSHYGNEIDLLVRNAQGGQTVGLPVGPDTSRVLAEVIASAIDVSLNVHLKRNSNDASRFVDDFTFGCNSVSEGQRIIAEVRRAVGHFELDISQEKTGVHETNHLAYVGWQEYIKDNLPKTATKAEFEKFFYVCHRMAREHANLNIDKFATNFCRKLFIAANDWGYLQEHLISTYRKNSTTIDSMVETFILRQSIKGDVDLNALTDFCESRLPLLAEQQRTGEVIWLLYMCLRLKITLSAKCLDVFFRFPNSLVAILILSLEKSGFIKGRIDQIHWDKFANSDGLRSDMWLYAYEVGVRGWQTSGSNEFVSSDPFYSALSRFGVRFVDPARGVEGLEAVLRARRIENAIAEVQKDYDEDEDFEGFEEFFPEPEDTY